MKASDRTIRSGWLYALPMAWATSALLLLDESRLLYALACLGWLGLAWKCLAGTRLALARRAIAFLLVLALPVQGFALTAVETRGPAHIHAPHASGHHWHGEVRHHHHAAGEAILVDDGLRERQHSLGTAEDKRLAFGGADSIAPSRLVISAADSAGAPPDGLAASRVTYVASALERPPRLLPASLPN